MNSRVPLPSGGATKTREAYRDAAGAYHGFKWPER